MATQTDHIRLDAESAARHDIAKQLEKIKRRWYSDAKAHIAEALASAEPGAILDGSAVGEAAVERAATAYVGTGEIQPVIEAGSSGSD